MLPRNFDTTVEYCWWNVKLENGVGAVEVLWCSSSLSHQPLLQHTCKPLGLERKTSKIRKRFRLELELAVRKSKHILQTWLWEEDQNSLVTPQNFGRGPALPSSAVLTPAADHQELNSLRDNRIDYHRWLLAATSSMMDSCGTGWENRGPVTWAIALVWQSSTRRLRQVLTLSLSLAQERILRLQRFFSKSFLRRSRPIPSTLLTSFWSRRVQNGVQQVFPALLKAQENYRLCCSCRWVNPNLNPPSG